MLRLEFSIIRINFRLTAFCQFDMKPDICGDVAQMGERGVRNAEVRGSIPLISTTIPLREHRWLDLFSGLVKLLQCDKHSRVPLAKNIFDVNRRSDRLKNLFLKKCWHCLLSIFRIMLIIYINQINANRGGGEATLPVRRPLVKGSSEILWGYPFGL